MDKAGNTATVNITINIDKTAPEGFIQFDPVTKNVLVFGRDPLSGRPARGDSAALGDSMQGGREQRTYRVTDLAGNTLTLVAGGQGVRARTRGRDCELAIQLWPNPKCPGERTALRMGHEPEWFSQETQSRI